MIELREIIAVRGAFRLKASLSVARGAHLSLIGPSGGGKSTMLDVIAGFLPVERGAVVLDGADCCALPPGARPVSMLFQEHNLFPHLTVAANVGLGVDPGLRLSGRDKAAVADSLAKVGLGGFGERSPADLSGGQRQRVAIARALLRRKPILLLDEPFAALGPAQRAEMLSLVADLRRAEGMTVVMVTHSPEDARLAGGDVAVVANGVVSPPRAAMDVLDDPSPELAEYLGRALR